MQLLTDAKVDFLIIDATNTLIYPEQSEALMQSIEDIQSQGKKAPKIVYYTNTESGKTMQNIFNTFYKEGAPYYHSSCWYYLDDKPLIIGVKEEAKGKNYASFFTFRESQWPFEEDKINGWPWISFTRPQHVYYNEYGNSEIVNVSVAQHPNFTAGMGGSAFYGNTDNWGRSYHKESHGESPTDILYGYNFQEQWDFALSQNVPIIFITGWNEWIAGRWISPDKNSKYSFFVDQADPEYSRDIEPTFTAGLKDNYYMQMVDNIRKYKGVAEIPVASALKTITKFDDWDNVLPTYFDYTGDTKHRNHPGAESTPKKVYFNQSGRNDFSKLKVARDSSNIFFYAKTVEEIIGEQKSNWMRLYLDIDRDATTDWYGYDYSVVSGNILQAYKNGKWQDILPIQSVLDGAEMMIVIPLEILNLDANLLDIEFKWSDNMQDESEPLDWYINGDAAPGARFNFIYIVKKQ